jgi:phosphoserine phosphatase
MKFVLTLIAADGTALNVEMTEMVRDALRTLGAETGGMDWLAPDHACDIPFDDIAPDQADAAARRIIGEAAIDCIAQIANGRRKKLLLADMDSTMVTSETLDDLAAQTVNGELDFANSVKERVMMLKGLSETALDAAYKRIEISPGAETAVRTMKANGTHCLLISGGFTYFTSRIAETIGFHEQMANDFMIEDGELTGGVSEPVLTKEVKLETLIARCREIGLKLAESVCVGDGANDVPMLQAAGLGVAYRGKPSVKKEIPARLDHADLTGLLFAQGYRLDEFID